MITGKVALRPENEAPRAVLADRRGTNYVSNDGAGDSTAALRLQRLRLLGIIGARAAMIAPVAWGEAA